LLLAVEKKMPRSITLHSPTGNIGNIAHLPLTRFERDRAVTRMVAAPQGPVSVMEIARRFALSDGHQSASRRTIIAHIRLLHSRYGFPAPATHRFENGVRINDERAIVWRSKWARDLVEAWFGHDDNPANAALAKEAGQDRTRNALADNARRLLAGANA
jgi:predicted AAA+ superfamily ATPase